MAQIRLDQFDEYIYGKVAKLIRTGTLEAERRLKTLTPVDTGRLRSNWQTQIGELEGTVSNNLPYAAPVIAGTDLPPSWQGKQRTTPFLDMVNKDMQTWLVANAAKIGREP